MHSARRYYQQRLRHHRQYGEDSSSSDDDNDSNNASSGSEGVEEYLSPSSSSSPSSTSSVDRKELALEMSSFSDSSEESDREEYVEESLFSPSSESDDEEKGDYVALERTMKLLQNLSVENLKHVEHFIKSLDAKDTPKPTPHFVKEPLPDLSQQSITPPKILSLGLSYVGFSIRRQASVREELNNRRFISFYGAPPQALAPLFRDVRDMFRQERPTCEDLFMTCNWLKCYDVMHVLEGRWGYCEDYMRPRIIRCQQMMQALRRQKMKFVQSATLITASLDTVTFTVQEFRNDPGSKWYDPKSKSAGLKYEFCVCTDEPGKQVWLRGPFPPGEFPDITIFRGGDEKTAMKDRDKCALYFEMPQDKKLAADSAYAGEYDRIVLTMPEMKKEEIKWLNRLKARGETLHGRLKSFRVLGTRFRHGTGTEDKMNRHQMATESVCLIVLYDCENGRPLFDQ